jgi:hypothetical protein
VGLSVVFYTNAGRFDIRIFLILRDEKPERFAGGTTIPVRA